MAEDNKKKISELQQATTFSGSEKVPLAVSGSNRSAELAALKEYFKDNNLVVFAEIVDADVTVSNSPLTPEDGAVIGVVYLSKKQAFVERKTVSGVSSYSNQYARRSDYMDGASVREDKIFYCQADKKIYAYSEGKFECISRDVVIEEGSITEDKLSPEVVGKLSTGLAKDIVFTPTQDIQSDNVQGALETLDSGKLGKKDIVQELGESEDKVLSQKAVSNELSKINGNNVLLWDTDAATTRKQVKSNKRSAGLVISYKKPNEDIYYSEQYIGASTTDSEWVKDANWDQVNTISNNSNEQMPLLFAVSDDSLVTYTEGYYGSVSFVNVGLLVNERVIVLNGTYNFTTNITDGLYLPFFVKESLLQRLESLDLSNTLDVSTLNTDTISSKKGLCICSMLGASLYSRKIVWKAKMLNYEDETCPEIISGGIIIDNAKTVIEDEEYIRVEVLDGTKIQQYQGTSRIVKSGTYYYKKNVSNGAENFYCYIDVNNVSSGSTAVFDLKFKHGKISAGGVLYQDMLPSTNLFRGSELPVAIVVTPNLYHWPEVVYPRQTEENFNFYRKRTSSSQTDIGSPQKDYNEGITSPVSIIDLGGVADANYHVYDYEAEDETSPKYGKPVGWYSDEECTIPATDNGWIFRRYSCPIFIPKGKFFVKAGGDYAPICRKIVGQGEDSEIYCSGFISGHLNKVEVSYESLKFVNCVGPLPVLFSKKAIIRNCYFEMERKPGNHYFTSFQGGGEDYQVIIENCHFYAKNDVYSCVWFENYNSDRFAKNCIISNCDFKLGGRCGNVIRVNGKVDNIKIIGNNIHAPLATTGIFIGSNRIGTAKNITISNNKLFGIEEESISFDGFGNNTSLMPPIARGRVVGKVYLPSNTFDQTGEKFKRMGLKIDGWTKWGKIGEGEYDYGYAPMTEEEVENVFFENYVWYIVNGKAKGVNGEIVGYDRENKVIETNIADYNTGIAADGTEYLEVMSGGFNLTVCDNYIRGNYGKQISDGGYVWSTGTGVCVYMGVLNAFVHNNRIEGVPKGIWVFNLGGEYGVPVYTSNVRIFNNFIECSRIAGISVYSGKGNEMECESHAILFNRIVNCDAIHIENQKRIEFKGNSIVNTPLVIKNSNKLDDLPEPSQGLSGQEFPVFEYDASGTFETVSTYVCKKNGDKYEYVKVW